MLPRLPLLLALAACSFPELSGEYSGVCKASEDIDFEIFGLSEDRGEGSVPGAEGEHSVYPIRLRIRFEGGDWLSGAGDRIFCLDEGGCSLGDGEDLSQVEENFYRMDLTWPDSGDRLVLDGVLDQKKTLEGTCWTGATGFGTFTAERVQAPWVDANETEQRHPGSD